MRTYVLRLHDARADDPEPDRLRGVVDEVATGERTTFRDDTELLRLLTAKGDDPRVDPGGAT